MATELLERTAIQLFKDSCLPFDVPQDDLVSINVVSLDDMPTPTIVFEIFDHKNTVLTIQARDFVRFAEDQTNYANTMCNVLNSKTFGKFFMDEQRYVNYNFDVTTTENTGPEDFEFAFWLSVGQVERFYSAIMTVRWANATVEQALERRDGGEPGTPIISDEQILRLLRKREPSGDSDQD